MDRITNAIAFANYGDIVGRDGQGLNADKKKLRTVQKQALALGTKEEVAGTAAAPLSNTASGDGVSMLIQQIDSTDSIVVEEITLYNPWIKSITPSDLSYDTEDLSSYDIEIRYDWAKILGPNT